MKKGVRQRNVPRSHGPHQSSFLRDTLGVLFFIPSAPARALSFFASLFLPPWPLPSAQSCCCGWGTSPNAALTTLPPQQNATRHPLDSLTPNPSFTGSHFVSQFECDLPQERAQPLAQNRSDPSRVPCTFPPGVDHSCDDITR